ncbi:MAG: hypothetical protein JW801_05970 [Bacteroidales bacterium]|nr:hypothetical protein [Bacteroidales bacterium]
MKQFLKKFLYFLIPFPLYILLVIVADPYNYWDNNILIPLETKLEISRELNGRLWKVVQYSKNPKANVMLGDSRVDIINSDRIKELTGEDYFNFGYPSATLEEIIITFDKIKELANEKDVKLKNVIIGCNFNLYNKFNNKNLIEATFNSSSQVDYILNGANIKAMAFCFYDMLTSSGSSFNTPDMDTAAFWKQQIEGPASIFYRKYGYPETFREKLQEIANYCSKNEISLTFFIPPTHTDLQDQIAKYHLRDAESTFKNDLIKIGKVVDFDYPSPLTSEVKNFSDPFHLNIDLDTILINALIKDRYTYCRTSTGTQETHP